MAIHLLADLMHGIEWKRDLNQSDDPRVGSARDNSTSSKVFAATTGTNSSSFASMFSTLVPVTVYAIVCVLIFWVARRKYPRVYSPRVFLPSLQPHERSKSLPEGWFDWVISSVKVPDTEVLNRSSLDGYLFLRFLKVLTIICLVGCCITWPVLLPLHSVGGNGNKQMDKLTFGNVANPSWYFVHAFLAWIFFGFVMYMVSRECVYYINLRQAYLTSPYYAKRLSSRTVLFTCIPQQVLDEARLRKLFGDCVKNVWIPRDTEDLDDLVKERDQTAIRLEKAEIELIKLANAARTKAEKAGHPDIEADLGRSDARSSEDKEKSYDPSKSVKNPKSSSTVRSIAETRPSTNIEQPQDSIMTKPSIEISITSMFESDLDKKLELKWGERGYGKDGPPDVNGSVAGQWIPHEMRPSHRPIANLGRRVDTIKWTRSRLKELAPKIAKLRRQHKAGRGRAIPAAFIEFHTQVDAQSAQQSLAHHRAFHMTPHMNGIRPEEIIWPSLRMYWWEKIIREFSVSGFVAAMVVFWSIPAALIGIVSNVDFLASDVFFLHWIVKLPSSVLGVIKGLLPAVALACLMALVPGIMRACARQSGIPTVSMVELYVQQTYFIFQVVQVFLITTLTSAASAAIQDIIKNPMSIRSLLSANLPKASNFYVSYFILQGLAMSATRIVHLSTLVRLHILKAPDNPRLLSQRWHRMRRVSWGSVYPVFTNMGVIAISYSCIAPLVLGFATLAFFLVYLVYHYNLLYVYDSEIDTRGLLYPHALKQILTGVYLAEVCLFGLFVLRSSFGPMVMIVMLIVFTALIHSSLNTALGPLLYNLPKTLSVPDLLNPHPPHTSSPEIPDSENPDTFRPPSTSDLPEYLRTLEGAPQSRKAATTYLTQTLKSHLHTTGLPTLLATLTSYTTPWISPDPHVPPNFFIKWLHPEIFSDHTALARLIADDLPDPEYEAAGARDAFWPPAVRAEDIVLWIPRDRGGVSRQEVAHSRRAGARITDEGVCIDERGRILLDLKASSPVVAERVRF